MESFRFYPADQHLPPTGFGHLRHMPPSVSHADMPCLPLTPSPVRRDRAAVAAAHPASTGRGDSPATVKAQQYSSRAPTPEAAQLPELTPDHSRHARHDQDQIQHGQQPGSGPLFIKQPPTSSPPMQHAAPNTRFLDITPTPPSANPGSREDPIDIEDSRVSSPPAPVLPQKGRKGRSLGENSTKHIRDLRAQAAGGNIDAALKLGWSVERLTALFNHAKIRRGVAVAPDQPIDDPDLLARIEQRKENGREASKRRAHKLKARAADGDIEAARKLKLSDKAMKSLFPRLTEDMPFRDEPACRQERSPTASFDFQRENVREGTLRSQITASMKERYGLALSQFPQASGPSRLSRDSLESSETPAYPAYPMSTAHPAQLVSSAPQPIGAAQVPPTSRHGHASWGTMRGYEHTYQMPLPSLQKEIQLTAARDEWNRMAFIAHKRARELEHTLNQHQRLHDRVGAAFFDAVRKAHVGGGGEGRKRKPGEWTFIIEDGMEHDVMEH